MSWKQVLEQWQNEPTLVPELKAELEALQGQEEKLEDAFYAPLEFGTAGMRGILGAGINRMNVYTIRQATEGLARFIDRQNDPVAKSRGVAIAYDSRHQSPEFADEAAKTLAAHGIQAYVFESLRPTPELSFAVRELNCFAGIMITASHNPAAYNGYKVYGEDGGQMPPQDADALTNFVRDVKNPLQVTVVESTEPAYQEFVQVIGEEMDARYLSELAAVTIDHDLIERSGKDLKLVFTPLHGTGKMLGEKALRQAGFKEFVLVPEQAVADPDFSTVHSPNPEEHSAFEYAIALGEKISADLLVATDPDADRLGAAVRLPNGEYQVITGNQLGALMVHYILEAKKQKGTLPANGAVLKSIVSSEFATKVAAAYDVETINVLTGFKFIAEKIKQYEQDHQKEYLFGFEESYGYLVLPFVRDKDAIQALVLLAEVAAYYKEKGMTLYDALQELFAKYGTFAEKTISLTMSGIEGSAQIQALMAKARAEAPSEFGGIPVQTSEDYQTGERRTAESVEKMSYPSSNVLKYLLEDGSWVAIRPSGTEPKIKFYLAVEAENQAAADAKLAAFEKSVRQLAPEA